MPVQESERHLKLFSHHTDRSPMFWAEMAPCQHTVQIYEEGAEFLRALEGFVAGGLAAGDGVVVIATPAHRKSLLSRLQAEGIDVVAAAGDDQLIMIDATEALARFMDNGWPDDDRFKALVNELLARAGRGGRKVRAFGEMVAILWGRGHCAATVRLEHLWHAVCKEHGFSLLCSYPRAGFTRNAVESIQAICEAHSHILETQ